MKSIAASITLENTGTQQAMQRKVPIAIEVILQKK